ncbi:hypothetical protein MRX96_046760 [Rhipicephalus microplus]
MRSDCTLFSACGGHYTTGKHATHKAIEEHLRWLGLDAALIRQLTPTIETIDDYLLKLGRDAYEDEEPDARNRSVLLLRTMEKAILGRKGGNWNHYLGNITNGLLPGGTLCHVRDAILGAIFDKGV